MPTPTKNGTENKLDRRVRELEDWAEHVRLSYNGLAQDVANLEARQNLLGYMYGQKDEKKNELAEVAQHFEKSDAQQQDEKDEATDCPPVEGTPDAVVSALAILAGEMPPWWTDHRPDRDDEGWVRELFLAPHGVTNEPPLMLARRDTVEMEQRLENGDLGTEQRYLLRAIEECIRHLRELADSQLDRRKRLGNDRLQTRLARACHEELGELVEAYQSLRPDGAPPVTQDRKRRQETNDQVIASLFQSDFDALDRAILAMSGRMGFHPAELMRLRFGDNSTAQFMRPVPDAADALGVNEEDLEPALVSQGILTAEAANWLAKRLVATPVTLDLSFLRPLDRGVYDPEEPGVVAREQILESRFVGWRDE